MRKFRRKAVFMCLFAMAMMVHQNRRRDGPRIPCKAPG